MWVLLGIIVTIIIVFGLLIRPLSNNKKDSEDLKPITLEIIKGVIEEINNLNPIDAIHFISNLNQKVTDEIYSFKVNEITDYLVRRAFLKKYRHESLDIEFWVSEINKRQYNKENGIKRKVKKRTKKEIYDDVFNVVENIEYNEEISGYNYVGIFEIKGVSFAGRYDYIDKNVNINDLLTLEKDDLNDYDKLAVKIKHKRKMIGFVDRIDTKKFRLAIDYGYKCYVNDFSEFDNWKTAYCRLYVKKFE